MRKELVVSIASVLVVVLIAPTSSLRASAQGSGAEPNMISASAFPGAGSTPIWSNISSQLNGAPPARAYAATAYDASDGYLLVFGGGKGTTCLGDTWILRNKTWSHLSPAVSPSPRQGMSMVYDSGLGEIVAFGGWVCPTSGLGLSTQTWTFHSGVWTLVSPSGQVHPPPLFSPYLAYDVADGYSVLYGGGFVTSGGVVLGSAQTWTFNGTTWTRIDALVGAHPPPSFQGVMAYDGATKQVIQFGGFTFSAVPQRETWAFSKGTWSELFPTAHPPGLVRGGLSYDPSIGVLVLAGGSLVHSGTFPSTSSWVYNGTTWLNAPSKPSGLLDFPAIAYDPALRAVILFGGTHYGPSGFVVTNDVWAYA